LFLISGQLIEKDWRQINDVSELDVHTYLGKKKIITPTQAITLMSEKSTFFTENRQKLKY
jgi:hypothetical protein